MQSFWRSFMAHDELSKHVGSFHVLRLGEALQHGRDVAWWSTFWCRSCYAQRQECGREGGSKYFARPQAAFLSYTLKKRPKIQTELSMQQWHPRVPAPVRLNFEG
jgi:hypothetical protein